MRLTLKKYISIIFFIVFVFLIPSNKTYCFNNDVNVETKGDNVHSILSFARESYQKKDYKQAAEAYQIVLEQKLADSVGIFKELSFAYAKSDAPDEACVYIEKYIKSSLDVAFINHSYFNQIGGTQSYQLLSNKYVKKFDSWSIFCFYVAFVGFFLSFVLNFRRRSDKVANFLMSAFVLLHSCFMIHIGLFFMNYQYYLPHTLYLFTTFSFLYGPLIYFYFKRVTYQYKFKYRDALHLLPTLVLIVLLFPIYLLPGDEKLRMVLNYERPYLTLISVSKLISLLVYGALVISIHIKSSKSDTKVFKKVFSWQRNIVIFCSIYILSYAIYAILNMNHLGSVFLYNIQVASIAVLVLYVSYSAFVQPSLFGNLKLIDNDHNNSSIKYEKSGLTQSLSLELKIKLLQLLNDDKIYKQNNITLQQLAIMLDTTRHNASQIINEHFELNFFELINKYRIDEAKELLKIEKQKNFNIIDVAYEVGFNNKVTFNKSFKKYNKITPSEYIKLYVS